MATAEQTARQQPGLVIAGGLALGLVAARFLRSAGGGSSGFTSQRTSQGGYQGSGSESGSDWYDVGAGTGSTGSSAANVGTRPYSMGATTTRRSESGFGNGSGTEDAYQLAESGE